MSELSVRPAGPDIGASRGEGPADSLVMRIERDATGCVHIFDEGVTAVVNEGAEQFAYTITGTATRCAVKRVCAVVADSSKWPTMRLRRLDVAPDGVVPVP